MAQFSEEDLSIFLKILNLLDDVEPEHQLVITDLVQLHLGYDLGF